MTLASVTAAFARRLDAEQLAGRLSPELAEQGYIVKLALNQVRMNRGRARSFALQGLKEQVDRFEELWNRRKV